MDWQPELPEGDALHERLAAALRRDVASGLLKPGERLPPQRVLAERLNISVGTVTKAFQEAERLGLVSGQVGRGTYVKGAAEAADAALAAKVIDLSVNITPLQGADGGLTAALRRLQRQASSADLLAYAPPAGWEAHRRAAVSWLARTARLGAADWSRLIITGGGQQAMTLACAALCAPNEVILCEAATYYGMKALAECAPYRLHGVAMDGEGVLPDALDRAAAATGARVAYLMPTAQVPTGRTMGAARRRDILKVARARRLRIIEDDHYALFAPPPAHGAAPLAQLAPDLCVYVSSLSKSLSPGLRTGFLVAPNAELFERIVRILRSTVYTNKQFGPLIMSHWIDDGSAFDIAAAMVEEVTARWQIAVGVLDPDGAGRYPVAPHIWLTLDELDATRAAGRAQRAGVLVTPPELPVLDPALIHGLRICVGGATSRLELSTGLQRLRVALAATAEVGLGGVDLT